MKFIVSSSYLQKNLQILGGIIASNNTLPILDNFLFELTDGELKVSASDMESTILGTLKVDAQEGGRTAVPARLLLDTLKTFPEQPLTFSQDDNSLIISHDKGNSELATANADEFPKIAELNDVQSTTVQGDVLGTAINKTIFAAGNDDLRPVMSGVFFQFNTDGITFVATDAHKLVKYHRSDISAPQTAEFIMPKKPLNLMKNMVQGSEDDVLIEYTENNARFTFDNITLICRLIDGKYPNYEAVIPKENPNVLTIERNQLLNSVRRVSIFASRTTHQIRLSMAGAELNISAEDIDYSNKAEERLTCDYQGDDMRIGFNSRFLMEMINNLNSTDVQLRMSMPNRAGILSPLDGLDPGEELTMLVMPVMLSD
jgi:DNA polymerase-3 subunit beta